MLLPNNALLFDFVTFFHIRLVIVVFASPRQINTAQSLCDCRQYTVTPKSWVEAVIDPSSWTLIMFFPENLREHFRL